MASGWRYRVLSVTGTAIVSVLAVAVANHGVVQSAFSLLPVVGHLPFDPPRGNVEFAIEAGTTVVLVSGALVPLYKPRARRVLDIVGLTVKRIFFACLMLAAIGYFDYTYRLPRPTLIVTGSILFVALPVYFVAIRRRPQEDDERIIVVGDDPDPIIDTLQAVDGNVLGYVSPASANLGGGTRRTSVVEYADGGTPASLGGLSRLDEVIVDHDIDTTVFAFSETDRQEFFGALGICHDHGVSAKIHRENADSVLLASSATGEIVDIDLEPWDWQERAAKRGFDIAFAAVGLLFAVPAIVVVAAAIKLEDGGPVLYDQDRTTEFGETFTVYKFRSMVPNSEREDPGEARSRITRVGRILRKTHLDELPQLWSILCGDMSVVGPRAAWVDEERILEEEVGEWQQRWFVKPGLTGLAQINDVSSEEPHLKLRYDIEYIRRRSFRFDVAIIIRQIWLVAAGLLHHGRADE